MANPTPAFERDIPSVAIAVFIPTKLPFKSNSAPPEFPGLIAASCCMKFSKFTLDITSLLPTALTIPAVTV